MNIRGVVLYQVNIFSNKVVYTASDNFDLVSSVGKSQLLLKLIHKFMAFLT